MVDVIWSPKFEEEFRKTRDSAIKRKVIKQIEKISRNPEIGKPLRYLLKGERTVYIKPYRLIYKLEGTDLTLLRFEHRDVVYD